MRITLSMEINFEHDAAAGETPWDAEERKQQFIDALPDLVTSDVTVDESLSIDILKNLADLQAILRRARARQKGTA